MNPLYYPISRTHGFSDGRELSLDSICHQDKYSYQPSEKQQNIDLTNRLSQQTLWLAKECIEGKDPDPFYSSFLSDKPYDGLFDSSELSCCTISQHSHEKNISNGATTCKSAEASSSVPENVFNFFLNLTDLASTMDTKAGSLSEQSLENEQQEQKIITRHCNFVCPYKTFSCSRDEDPTDGQGTDYTAIVFKQPRSLTSGCESIQTDYSQTSKQNVATLSTLNAKDIAHLPHTTKGPKEEMQNFFLNVTSNEHGPLESGKATMVSTPSCPPGTPTCSVSSDGTIQKNGILGALDVSQSYYSIKNTYRNVQLNHFLSAETDDYDGFSLKRSISSADHHYTVATQKTEALFNGRGLEKMNFIKECSDSPRNFQQPQLNLASFSNHVSHTRGNESLWTLESQSESRHDPCTSNDAEHASTFLIPHPMKIHHKLLSNHQADCNNTEQYYPFPGTSREDVTQTTHSSQNVDYASPGEQKKDPHYTLSSLHLFKSLGDLNILSYASKRWQNLNVVLPIYIPHGVIAIIRSTGENTYVFSDDYPASQLLFSGSGRICDMWATYLRLRVAVIHKCPEFLVPRVAQVFNEKLSTLPKFSSPIRLRCSGIVKHTIRLRSSEGLTYRYDTIGQFCDAEDKRKMGIIFDALQTVLVEINAKLTKEVEQITKLLHYSDMIKSEKTRGRPSMVFSQINDLRASILDNTLPRNDWGAPNNEYNHGISDVAAPCYPEKHAEWYSNEESLTRPKCGLEFRFSPCKELKIPIREGSVCECVGADSMIAGGGASSMSSWAKQFTVDGLILGEIRLERDKTSETQLDPFFLPAHEIKTRVISKDFDKEPARVIFVDPNVYPALYRPTVKLALDSNPFNTARELCGATHEILARQLPKGLASLLPQPSYFNVVFPDHVTCHDQTTFQPASASYPSIKQGYCPIEGSKLAQQERYGVYPYRTGDENGEAPRFPYELIPGMRLGKEKVHCFSAHMSHPSDSPRNMLEASVSNTSLTKSLRPKGNLLIEDKEISTNQANNLIMLKKMLCHVGGNLKNETQLYSQLNSLTSHDQHTSQLHPTRYDKEMSSFSNELSKPARGRVEASDFASFYSVKPSGGHEPRVPQLEQYNVNGLCLTERYGLQSEDSTKLFDKSTAREEFSSSRTFLSQGELNRSKICSSLTKLHNEHLYSSQDSMENPKKNELCYSQDSSRDEYGDTSPGFELNRASSQYENQSKPIGETNSLSKHLGSPGRSCKSLGGTPSHRREVVNVNTCGVNEPSETESRQNGSLYLFYSPNNKKKTVSHPVDGLKAPSYTSTTTTTGGDSSTSESLSSLQTLPLHAGAK